MKKIIYIGLSIFLLMACTNNDVKDEVIDDYKVVAEDVTTEYKTISIEDDTLDKGEEIVDVEGVNGTGVVVFKILEDGSKEYLNDWTYTSLVNKVVRVGTKEEIVDVPTEPVTPPSNNNGGSTVKPPTEPVAPPSNNNGGSTVKPPTEPTKPQEVKPVNPNSVGNSGMLFNTREEADNWAMYQMDNNWDGLLAQLGWNDIGGWGVVGVRMTDDTEKYSVHFY